MAQDGPAWPGKMGPSSVWQLHIKRKLFVIGSQDRLKMGPHWGFLLREHERSGNGLSRGDRCEAAVNNIL